MCDFDVVVSDRDTTLASLLTVNSRNLILDIDLDFFSTCDPFKAMFKSVDDYELYKRVYSAFKMPQVSDPNFLADYNKCMTEKKLRLERIRTFLSTYQTGEEDSDSDLARLRRIFIRDSLDTEILHEYGSGLDECPLPEHVSTSEEVCLMMDQMVEFLGVYMPREGSLLPGCLTIARSSLDDYCPADQVDFIQEQALKRIRAYFNSIDDINLINFFYKNS